MSDINPESGIRAYLQDIDTTAGVTPEAGYLRVTLCGFGFVIPRILGVGVLANAGVPQTIGPQVGTTPLQMPLWGNDSITPAETFYEVAVLDENRNVIQAGNYILNNIPGGGYWDLSVLEPIIPPYGFGLGALAYIACGATGSPTVWQVPGKLIALAYNGILLPQNVPGPPPLSYLYDPIAHTITLNFTPSPGDRIDALAVVE